jgi:hypothetical protein
MARNQKGRVINRALRKQHRTRVRQAADQGVKGLWKIARWAQGGRPDGVVPALKRPEGGPEAKTIQEKAECLREILFPKPPEADLMDIGRFHPKPLEFPAITSSVHQVKDNIFNHHCMGDLLQLRKWSVDQ